MRRASFSVQNVTGPLREIALFIPNTYALSDIRGIIFGMSPEVGGGVSHATGWAIMTGYLLASGAAAFAMHHTKLTRGVR